MELIRGDKPDESSDEPRPLRSSSWEITGYWILHSTCDSSHGGKRCLLQLRGGIFKHQKRG